MGIEIPLLVNDYLVNEQWNKLDIENTRIWIWFPFTGKGSFDLAWRMHINQYFALSHNYERHQEIHWTSTIHYRPNIIL